jgi:uncharacterized protein (TIGR03085 family)
VRHIAHEERLALCDLFLEVGPDAPTLCEGWSSGDLAAHLLIRERRPDTMPGVVLRPFAAYTNRVLKATRVATSWGDLVARLRSGPPGPLRLIDEPVNTVEYFVHHEDVRRVASGWEPRKLDGEEEAALWKRLRLMGRVLARRVPVGMAVDAPGFGQATLRRGQPLVVVRGEPSEMILLAFGRGRHARVDYDGDEISIERLRHASFGL